MSINLCERRRRMTSKPCIDFEFEKIKSVFFYRLFASTFYYKQIINTRVRPNFDTYYIRSRGENS